MFIYLVVGISENTGVDISTACNFVELEDAKTYATFLSSSHDRTEIYLNKTDGTFMLLDLE
jgi:hypothetical protein